jgi:phosphatidate cytidylyltransferase
LPSRAALRRRIGVIAMGFPSLVLTRTASAIVLGLPVLLVAYLGSPLFELIVALAAVVLAWEWFALCGGGLPRVIGYTQGAVLLVAVMAVAGFGIWQAIVALVIGTVIVLLVSRGESWLSAGTIYLGLPCVALVWLRNDTSDGRDLVCWLIIVVWGADTGAYIVGRLIGGPRLAPGISPNKTWAGLAGGVGLAAATSAGFAGASGQMQVFSPAAAGAVLGLTAQIGDLAESWVKRRFGVKDTSRLIPGHGGLLDRVDGLLIVVLVVALFAAADKGNFLQWL